MSKPLIEARDVVKAYSNHLALDKVSVSVPENHIFGLLGPNGAGKTTLIRIINQITAPDSGELLLDGKRMSNLDVEHIGYLPEERGLYRKMKVGEQALYLSQLKGLSRNDAMKKLKYWFDKFDILPWWDKKVEELSKGMQQKVQFITTVLHEPKLLIFDEPFSGFDPVNAQLLKDEILELKKKGATIIFSTHNMSSVEEICDDIALINKSKVILEGNVTDIKHTYKSNTFRFLIEGNNYILNGNLPKWAGLMDKKEVKGDLQLIIQLEEGHNPNDVLKVLMKDHSILGFEELIPSMNDIFIKVVS
ncbi:ABC transporter ATP-binding protein [Saccharicrinis sp. FJH62]|uniref:ABC transporter ATP-binding protein n=1 Tax=Saccharicrinis sp. FJH62 TaxID=3344657 RepID=UPI0035D4B281